jgi:hypothetical protein
MKAHESDPGLPEEPHPPARRKTASRWHRSLCIWLARRKPALLKAMQYWSLSRR